MTIFDAGHTVAASRVSSYFSPSKKYIERLKGLDFYWFLSDILERFDKDSNEILANLNNKDLPLETRYNYDYTQRDGIIKLDDKVYGDVFLIVFIQNVLI